MIVLAGARQAKARPMIAHLHLGPGVFEALEGTVHVAPAHASGSVQATCIASINSNLRPCQHTEQEQLQLRLLAASCSITHPGSGCLPHPAWAMRSKHCIHSWTIRDSATYNAEFIQPAVAGMGPVADVGLSGAWP